MKVALIGKGRWGQILHKELEKQAEIKYACDSKTDLGSVFADHEVEAVFIATPTETHFEIADKALEAGKHVFLEKPGTTSSADLEKLITKAREKKLKLAIGYEFPHHSAILKLRKLTEGRKIKSLHLNWQKWGTFKDDAAIHLLCHDVSILKLLGFKNLSPLNHQRTRVISDSDVISTQFANSQGVFIKSIINRVSPFKQKTLTLLLEEGGGYVVSNNDLFSINTEKQTLDKIELPATTPVAAELADFLSAIKEDREPQSSGEWALEIFKIIEQVQP